MNIISKDAYQLLNAIVEKAKETKDHYIIAIDMPSEIHRGKRKELANELKQNGYIEKAEFLGKDKLRCRVTSKGMNIL